MTTPAKIAANRANAMKSTGPRTDDGKARSAANALTHGLLSSRLVLPDEQAADLDRVRDGLYAHFAPNGELELTLVDRIAEIVWRLRRVGAIEAGIVRGQVRDQQLAQAARNRVPGSSHVPEDRVDVGEHVAQAFAAQFAMVTCVSRYETALQRNVLRVLHELERVQARRCGEVVTVPAVVDLDVAVGGADTHVEASLAPTEGARPVVGGDTSHLLRPASEDPAFER
jgi:hypothetical protein